MAYYYILKSLNLPRDSEIIFPALTFWVVPEMARVLGFRPKFVDIDPETFNIDPVKMEAAITPTTRVVVPTHLYGQPCEMEPIMAAARRHGVFVIEDCAHALGATYKGSKVGTLGQSSFFSFQILKPLNTYVGGMAVTNYAALAERNPLSVEDVVSQASKDDFKNIRFGNLTHE